jgi:NAD(P)H-hydrate epimerase
MDRSGHDAFALLTNEEMRRADAMAIEGGVAGAQLMERAGQAVAQAIEARWRRQRVLVLAGPGNNGGDGYVAARLMRERGWPVAVAAIADTLADTAAATARQRWGGPVRKAAVGDLEACDIVVDAMFGAGLGRPLEGIALELVETINASHLPVVAVDVPSGVGGDDGAVRGAAPQASLTVTFFRAKPGHWLLPGRSLCGELAVADIGIPASVLDAIKPKLHRNDPALWRDLLYWPRLDDHKYRRGHLLVFGGEMTGAGRLAVRGARRSGAGMVTVAADPAVLALYAADQPGAIAVPTPAPEALAKLVASRRVAAMLIGPGAGVGGATKRLALAALSAERSVLLDADALSVFAGDVERLAQAIKGPVVLTPHEGEFARLFPDLPPARGKVARAREAAKRLGAVVVFKGADSVVAAPDGRALINGNASGWLASAGTGDVLAGLVAGLLAQGMAPFEAAAAGVWMHGAAAATAGPGLIAEDLPERLPEIWRALQTR